MSEWITTTFLLVCNGLLWLRLETVNDRLRTLEKPRPIVERRAR